MTVLKTCSLTPSLALDLPVHRCKMCVQKLHNGNTFWHCVASVIMNIMGSILPFFKKTREVFSNVNGTPCRRSLGNYSAIISFRFGDSRTNNFVDVVFSWSSAFWRLCVFSLNSEIDMRALCLFTVITHRFPRAGSTYGRIGSLRDAAKHGYTISFVRATSVTCGGPSSNIICFRIVFVDFRDFHQCFCRYGVVQKNRNLSV